MGYHRRHISNSQVIELYQEEGVTAIINMYTKGCDTVITEGGVSSDISGILGRFKKPDKIEKEIIKRITKELNLNI